MREISPGYLHGKLAQRKPFFPFIGQIELTYSCNLECSHCYCKGLEGRELTTAEWKKILEAIHKDGCLWLTITGGEPLVRDDFLEIYSYAKKKGFIINLFTNAFGLTKEILAHLTKSPPFSIEVTLNGVTKETYERVTQVKGSFPKVISNIRKLAKNRLSVMLKTNCLKINRCELGKIKTFSEELLGRLDNRDRRRFRYDTMVHPRLDRDKTPCNYRLSARELLEMERQNSGIEKEYQNDLHGNSPNLVRDRNFLYHCNTWRDQFFINPNGWLRFCVLSDKFNVDLKTTPFKDSFYSFHRKILAERFKTNSPCRDCKLRSVCYYCPGRSFLETGNEEGPVPYYCQLAQEMEKEMFRAKSDAEPK